MNSARVGFVGGAPPSQEVRFGLPFGHDDTTRRGLSHTLSGGRGLCVLQVGGGRCGDC